MTTRAPERRPPAPPPAPPADAPRRIRIPAFLLVSLAAILGATLYPSSYEGALGWDGCILCGDRGLADALLNVVLFAPLGAALARLGVRPLRAIAAAAALSVCIELAQLLIPGRDPAPPDLLFNTLGGAVGWVIGMRLGVLLRPSPHVAGRMAVAWSLLFAAAIAATGWLTAPAPPPGPYVGQWTPEIGDYPLLPARILDARIGGVPVFYDEFGPRAAVRAALARGDRIDIEWIVGWRIGRSAPLLRIVGRGGEEAAAVFIRGEDAIFIHRTRAAALLLDQPTHAAHDVIRGIVPGDTLRLAVWLDGRATELRTDAGYAARNAMGPGRGWALLWSVMGMTRDVERLLDGLWIALWMLPLGLWMRRRALSLPALPIAAAALALLPPLVSLAPPGPVEIIGALVGLLAGAALGRIVR